MGGCAGYRGVMYFGNNKGVLEFDGVRWNTYPLPNRTIVRSLPLMTRQDLRRGQDELGYLGEGRWANRNT